MTAFAKAPDLPTFVPERHYSIAEWLAIEEASGERYEYHDGFLVSVRAMAGGTFRHALLIGNVTHALGDAVRREEEAIPAYCNVLSSDLRLGVVPSGRYYYPDVAVVCGRPRFDEIVPTAVVNPVCVCEVLSPSSEGFDSGEKFDRYAELETLRDYVLVSQNRRRVEVRSRASVSDPWRYKVFTGTEAEIRLDGLGYSLPFAGVYRGWAEADPEAQSA